MTDELIPGLGASLAVRAQERAEARTGRRRHRVKVGFATLGAVALLSSGAYAARGLWQPELGQPTDTAAERPVADDAPPAELALRHLAVLRREQTDDDRGTASQAALKISAPRMKVLTNSVRRLGDVPGVGTAVLVPMKRTRSGEHTLCIAIDGGKGLESRSRGCSPVRQLLDGGVVIGIGVPLPDDIEQDLAAARKEHFELRQRQLEEQQQHDEDGAKGVYFTTPPELMARLVVDARLDVIGIVPDGAVKVRLTKDGPTFPVKDNLFHGRVREAESGNLAATFLDANGKPLPPIVAPKPVEPPTDEDLGLLGEHYARFFDPALRFHIREVVPGIVKACTVIRARPRTTEEEQQQAVQAALASITGDLPAERLAHATEILRGAWCQRPYR